MGYEAAWETHWKDLWLVFDYVKAITTQLIDLLG